jgi:hypothetical protein
VLGTAGTYQEVKADGEWEPGWEWKAGGERKTGGKWEPDRQ